MDRSTIEFNGVEYPCRSLTVGDYGYVKVSVISLCEQLFDASDNYISEECKNIDEEIFFFVPDDEFVLDDAELEYFILEYV